MNVASQTHLRALFLNIELLSYAKIGHAFPGWHFGGGGV